MTLNNVVFPAPLGPITARISPAFTVNETRDSAARPKKLLLTSWTSRMEPGGGIGRRRTVGVPSEARARVGDS
jgi:hypothetical protein